MIPDCRNYCKKHPVLTKPENRPGLPSIRYRIGTYTDFKNFMLDSLNKSEVLSSWTHREPDDPGIALLEGASIVLDILTFYEELYSNEVFLRTATWRESINALVRLTGYRLAPGLGGRATFAFLVKPGPDVLIPKHFPVKAQLEGSTEQANFETDELLTAVPSLGKFKLYRQLTNPIFTDNVTAFSVVTADLEKSGMEINKKDRILLLTDPTDKNSPIVTVAKTETKFDRTYIFIDGSVSGLSGKENVRAFKLGRTFRHFGYNAPLIIGIKKAIVSPGPPGGTTTTFEMNFTNFDRNLSIDTTLEKDRISPLEIPLDVEVPDFALGGTVILSGAGKVTELIVNTVRTESMSWGAITGASTILTISSPLTDWGSTADIRKIIIHETVGNAFELENTYIPGPDTDNLYYFGDLEAYKKLHNRSLSFLRQDGAYAEITASVDSESLESGESSIAFRKIAFTWPEGWSVEDFPKDNPSVNVFGNIVTATQGKKEKEAVLGNGDARQVFQTFRLPKAPLTYTNPATGDAEPRLEIYVDNWLWTGVPTLFGYGSADEIYIVREDDEGNSWVQFGDGKTGRRLPTGTENVKAVYRTGIGAQGELMEGTEPQAGDKLDRLEKISLAGIVSGGNEPESGIKAQEAAPGKVQSLGRLVSLRDFECEALGLPAVELASAFYDVANYTPSIILTVLMRTGREKELQSVSETMNRYNRCRGPGRYPVVVHQGLRKYVHLEVTVSYRKNARPEVVNQAIKEALGVQNEEGNGIDSTCGLFSTSRRRFGQEEYAARVEGVIQNIDGVLWVKVTAFAFADTIGTVPYPLNDIVPCDQDQILNLSIDNLRLNDGTGVTEGECS